eukprot:g5041.t1
MHRAYVSIAGEQVTGKRLTGEGHGASSLGGDDDIDEDGGSGGGSGGGGGGGDSGGGGGAKGLDPDVEEDIFLLADLVGDLVDEQQQRGIAHAGKYHDDHDLLEATTAVLQSILAMGAGGASDGAPEASSSSKSNNSRSGSAAAARSPGSGRAGNAGQVHAKATKASTSTAAAAAAAATKARQGKMTLAEEAAELYGDGVSGAGDIEAATAMQRMWRGKLARGHIQAMDQAGRVTAAVALLQ